MSLASSYLAVAFIGLIHGLEPGHGWPIAALISFNKPNRLTYGLITSLIIASAHFLSSVFVLLIYYLASSIVDFSSPYFRYVVAAILIIIAIRMFLENPTDAEKGHIAKARSGAMGMRELGIFALILGFAHEEEFMLLALAIGGVNPMLLILVYATSVTISIVGITLFAIKGYSLVEHKMKKYERYIPKITGLVLLVLAALFILGVY